MFNFYKPKGRWWRGVSLAILFALIGSTWSFAQTNYYSKAAATDFTAAASWGANADGSGAAPGSVSNADNFFIANGSAMNLTAGNASVRNLTINAGSLTVGSNTLTVSLPTGNTAGLVINSGGTLTASGGSINVNGYVTLASGGTLNQSAGTIRIDGNDNNTPASSVPSGTNIFGVTAASATNFNLTGGTIWIVDPHVVNSTSLGRAFGYTGSVNMSVGVNHTFRFGNGASTQGTANTGGFVQETYIGSTRVLYGNLIIDAGNTSPQNLITQQYTGQWVGVQRDMTIISGDYRNSGTLAVGRDLVNDGTLTTTGTLAMANSSGTSGDIASTFASTVSGSGVFRNNTGVSTANFANLLFNNSNAAGVTFSNTNSLLSGANTGTVSTNINFKGGTVTATVAPLISGISATSGGTITWTAGGMAPGSTLRRWLATTTLTTSTTPTQATASHRAFPFAAGSSTRMVLMTKSGTWTTGGWIEATHTNVAGLSAAGFLDGAYSVDQITNASWSFNSGGGINLGATSLAMGLCAEGIVVTAATPGTAPRLVQAAGAVKTHAAGTGSTSAPFGCRSGLLLTDLAVPQYVGIASADIGFYSIANGAWDSGTTWSKGFPPSATDNPLVSSGTTVTVNAAAASALTVSVSGTLNVTGNTLTVTGAAGTGLTVNAGGVLSVSGGSVDIGPQDNSVCNRIFLNNGTLNVSGTGNLNVAGSFTVSAAATLNQTGGTIKVDGNAAGSAANSIAGNIVIFNQSSATTTLSGGTFLIVDPSYTTSYALFVSNISTTPMVATGTHTFQMGDGVSSDAGGTNGFYMNLWSSSTNLSVRNMVVNGGAGTNRHVASLYTYVNNGNFTVNAGSESRIATIWVGGNVLNNGTLTSTTGLNFANYDLQGGLTSPVASAQSIGGSGTFRNLVASPTANLTGLRIQNSSVGGVTMNIPLTMSGTLTMFEGKLNTTATNLLTMYSATGNVSYSGAAGPASWVNGPMARRIPASTAFNSFFATMPVGKTAPNWFVVNASTNAAGYIEIMSECFNSNAGTNGSSLASLNANRRWETSLSGPGTMTSYAVTLYDNNAVNGNAIGATPAYPATSFEVVGNGANWTAGVAPLLNTLAMSTNEITGTMPQAFGFGNTGPLNVTLALGTQVAGNISVGSTNNSVTRVGITAVGSSGTVTLTDLIWTYTGSNAADIAANGVTLWSGTITAPTAQIGAGVSLSGGFATFSGLSVNVASGSTFLWVRVNTAGSATIGNTVDGKIEAGNLNFAVSGGATATPPIPAADLDPAGNLLIDYCQALFTNACSSNDFLTAFSLNSLSSSPGCPGATPTNYAKLGATTTLQQGNAYTANFTVGTGGAQGVAIWFDFNHDGDFADAGEFFATAGTTAASGSGTLNITVDPAALTGATRMRVMNRWNTTFVQGDVCLNPINYGTTVDYDVTISSPSPRALDPITAQQVAVGMGASSTNNNLLRVDLPTSGSLGTLTLTQIRFTYTGTSATDIAASGVTLWTGTSSAPTAQIGSAVSLSGGLANFTGLSTALAATNYLWLRVNTSATAAIGNLVDAKVAAGDITIVAAGGATAPGSQPPSDVDPAGTSYIDYCPATYASGCGLGDNIANVTLNGASINLSNTTGCTPNPYYTYYSGVNKPDLFQGTTYPISVTVGTDGTQWVGCWVDFNQNGVFETTEYFEKTSVTGSSGTATFNIAVPITASLGNTRMRIRGGNDSQILNTQACGTSSSGYGETEDYIVTIIPPPNCSTLLPFPATAATASTTTVCSGSNVTFGLSVPMPSGTGITYQWRRNGANLGAPVSTTTHTIPVTLAGNYDVQVLCNGTPQLTSTAVAISVFNPSVTGTTPATRCGPGTLTLSATGSVGTTLKWYTTPTGGAGVTGASFPTPSLGVGVTPYYVSATQIFGIENGGKAAFTPGTGFVTTGWGIVFSAATDIVMNTVDVYPYGTGDIVIGLYASDAVTLLAETPAIPVSGSGTVQTVPLNFDVPAGANYRILIKSYNGITGLGRDAGTFPNNSPSGALSVTASEWGGTTTGTNYFFYNFNISRVCASPRTLVNATVNNPPFLSVTTANNSICSGLATSASASGFGYTSYTWTPALGVAPAGPGSTKTLNPTVTTSYQVTATGGGCNNTATLTIFVKPSPTNPTPIVPVPAAGFCLGGTKAMSTTATAGGNLNLIEATFDDNTLGGWTLAKGGTSPTDWAVVSAPYSYAGQITNFSVSPSPSPFLIVNSDVLGSGSSAGYADLISPSFSTLGYPSVTLSFDHVYRTVGSNISATVQYSTDGGVTWSANVYFTNVTTPAQSWDAANILVTNQVITLPAGAGNKPNVKLRFRCDYDWDYYWMIDNIKAYVPATVEYRWSSNFALSGLTAPSQVYSGSNSSVVATPTQGGTMTYTVDVRNTMGCVALAPATHTVNVSEIVIAPTNSGPQRAGTNLSISTTATGGFGGYTYQWRKLPSPVVINATSSFTYPGATVANSGQYQVTVTDGQGCSNVLSTDALVYDALVWNGSQGNSWTDPLNWTPPIVPANGTDCTTPLSRDNVVITNSGTPPIYPGAGVYVDNFGVESGTLSINNTIRVCGALSGGTIVGKVVGPGSIELVGSATNLVGGLLEVERLSINKTGAGAVQFQGTLRVNDLLNVAAAPGGINVTASGAVVLRSTATQTGKIGVIPPGTPIAVTAPGGFVQERFLGMTVPNAGSNGQWFFLGSPMQNKNFTDWSDDFMVTGLTSGFGTQGGGIISSSEPERSTIFKYVEALHPTYVDTVQKHGWRIPGAIDGIGTGTGYRVWVKRYGSNNMFDNKGLINSGNQNMTLTRSTAIANCQYGVTASTIAPCTEGARGWNLLANPYPCAIDWDAVGWTKPAGMQNAVYTWNSNLGGYRAYIGTGVNYPAGVDLGFSTISGNANPNIIPSSQGFMVKVTSGTGGTLTVAESAKSVTNNGTFSRSASNSGIMSIKLASASLADTRFTAAIKLDPSATDGFDESLDLEAISGNFAPGFEFGTEGGSNLWMNAIAIPSGSKILPIFMNYNGRFGAYSFSFNQVGSFYGDVQMFLRDNYLGTITEMISGGSYEYLANDGDESSSIHRFEVLISSNGVTGISNLVDGVGFDVYPNPASGSSDVTLAVSGVSGSQASIVVVDVVGKVVYTNTMVIDPSVKTNSKSINMGLAAGIYTVKVITPGKTLTEKLVIR